MKVLSIKGSYYTVVNPIHTLDMNKTDSRNIFSANQLVNNFTRKPVTTGQILDFSPGRVTNNESVTNQTSYLYNMFTTSGIVDTIQLKLTDNTISNMDFQT